MLDESYGISEWTEQTMDQWKKKKMGFGAVLLNWGDLYSPISFPGDIWHVSRDIGGGIPTWSEARDAAKHPTEHRTAPHNKELSGAKSQ